MMRSDDTTRPTNGLGDEQNNGIDNGRPVLIQANQNNGNHSSADDLKTPSQAIKFLTEEDCEYIGFECSKILPDGKSYFEERKKEILDFIEEEIEEEKIIYQHCDELLAEQIDILKQDMERIRTKMKDHLASLDEIRKQIEIAAEKRSKLENELREKLLDWGRKKASIVEAAIENSKKELQQLIDSYQELYTKRQEVNRQKFEDHKEANAEMLRRKQEEEHTLREEQESLLQRLALLYLDKGSRKFAVGIMLSGLLTAFAVSWLYFFHVLPEIDWLRPLEGIGISVLLVCLVGFASYFYHGRIVEPRIIGQKNRGELNYWAANLEMIVACIIGFISIVLITHDAFLSPPLPLILSFLAFMLAILSTGILIGYGMRMWKLLSHLYDLNKRLTNLSTEIIALQKPEPLNISKDEADKFKTELNYHLSRLYQLLSIKYSLPKYAVGYRDWHERHYWIWEHSLWWGARLLRRIFFFLPVSSELAEQVNPIYPDEELADANFRILNWERHLFPDVIADLETTRQAYARARLHERGLFKKLIAMSEERDDLTKALRERLQLLTEDADKLTARRRKLADDYQSRVRFLKRRKILLANALDTGFHIGLKYREEIDTPRRLT
ncbi:MAG: hypothetical protein KatS3mg030_684 [Saprospiraceae bacterium]|nr:MAG: hypothetical protein KatS3mg030_684 [Saprospiraceae bacterium]